jgi:hypothetical protein
MTTNAKFEAFCTSHRDEHGLCFFTVKKPDSNQYVDSGTRDALLGWQAALSSLEVTPQLVATFQASIDGHSDFEVGDNGYLGNAAVSDALASVFAAIKEGKA